MYLVIMHIKRVDNFFECGNESKILILNKCMELYELHIAQFQHESASIQAKLPNAP